MVYHTFNLDIEPKYIVEIGTHYGTESLLLEKKHPKAHIYTYEADTNKHQRIEHSFKNNNSNVHFKKIGLSNQEKDTPFYKFTGYENDGADSLFNRYNGEMKHVYNVPITTLKKEMEKNELSRIDLLCMDTQGSELNILKGLGDNIDKVKYIIMEMPDVICDASFFKIPKGKDSVYDGGGNSKDLNIFLHNNNFIEIERRRENELESNVMFKRVDKLKFDCVLTAVNDNALYLEYIPNFIKCWKHLFNNIDIVIVLVMDEIPQNLKDYTPYLRLFKPIEGLDTAYIAQNIRIYYPAILDKRGVLITDIDIYPMNKKYYLDPINNISSDTFMIYRPLTCVEKGQIALCYCMASSDTWSKTNQCQCLDDVKNILIKNYPSNYGKYRPAPLDWLKWGWFNDQVVLYNNVIGGGCNHKVVGDGLFFRIDKMNLTLDNVKRFLPKLKNGGVSDFIPCRPDSKNYKDINDWVVNGLIQ